MCITHFEQARSREWELGHLRGRWTMLGESAGSVGVGARRIEVRQGAWSTPAHEHGRAEELFYVMAGRGVCWQAGNTTEIGPGDCVLFRPHRGAHTVYAVDELDLLAFGPREYDEGPGFPRLGKALTMGGIVETAPGVIDRAPAQFVHEAALGPPELPEPGPRPATIVNLDSVQPEAIRHGRIERTRRNLGRAVGSVQTGLQHVEVPAGMEATPQHCHSAEEEIFVVLEGGGVLMLGEEELPVHAGTVVSRPPGTGVAHTFRAGQDGLRYLAYGTRDPSDICYYPRSNKIFFRGVGIAARLVPVDYWDGEG